PYARAERRAAGCHPLPDRAALPRPPAGACHARDGSYPPDPRTSRASWLPRRRGSAVRWAPPYPEGQLARARSEAAGISSPGAARCALEADASPYSPRTGVGRTASGGHGKAARGARGRTMSNAAESECVQILTPEWPVPPNVHAAFTLRSGGVSTAPFASLNLGAHVGDRAAAVAENRRRVRTQLRLPHEPAWMEQVHGTAVLDLDMRRPVEGIAADAAITRRVGPVCAVQVADCLPVLLAISDGSAVAAAHAGWRGLVAGVLEAAVKSL